MTHRFGKRSQFALEIGEYTEPSGQLRVIDVWAAGRWLTCDDNHAYLPQFIETLQCEVRGLLRDSRDPAVGRPYPALDPTENHRRLVADAVVDNTEHLAYRFMDWGPTADNVTMHLLQEGGVAYLPFSFWREDHHEPSERGRVFVAELPEWELAEVLHRAVWKLVWDWAESLRSPGLA